MGGRALDGIGWLCADWDLPARCGFVGPAVHRSLLFGGACSNGAHDEQQAEGGAATPPTSVCVVSLWAPFEG